jgi:thiol-disulfide isomerase/thioredoxin
MLHINIYSNIILLFALLNCTLCMAQTTTLLSVERCEYIVEKNSKLIYSASIVEKDKKSVEDSSLHKIPLSFLSKYSIELLHDTIILYVLKEKNSYSIHIKNKKYFSFLNSSRIENIVENKQIVFDVLASTKSGYYKIPFELKLWVDAKHGVLINIANRLTYKINFKIDETEFTKKIVIGGQGVPANVEHNHNGVIQNFLLDEKMIFQKNVIKLFDLDLKQNKIKLLQEPLYDKVIGYKQGYYLSPESLSKLTSFEHDKINKRKFFILNFWGKWCAPCLNHLDDLGKLEKELSKKDNVTMVSIRFVLEKNGNKDYSLQTNLLQPFKNQIEENQNSLNKSSSLITSLNVIFYPTYLVVDTDGKILLAHQSDYKKFKEKLSKILQTF